MKNIFKKTIGFGDKHIVMFHGWGFNHTVLLDWCALLTKDFTCYLIDLPGHGYSSFINNEEWFDALHTQIPRPFDLLGWSLGGLYAIKYAELFPEDVNNLYLLATSPYFIADTNWPGIDYKVFRTFQQQLINNPEATLASFINLHSKGIAPQSWQYIPPNILALEAGVEALITWDLRKNLLRLPHTIFLTLGRLDKIIPAELALAMQSNYPQIHTTLLSKTGHMPFLTHKVRYNEENFFYWYRD